MKTADGFFFVSPYALKNNMAYIRNITTYTDTHKIIHSDYISDIFTSGIYSVIATVTREPVFLGPVQKHFYTGTYGVDKAGCITKTASSSFLFDHRTPISGFVSTPKALVSTNLSFLEKLHKPTQSHH
jgi:hypothetical protein